MKKKMQEAIKSLFGESVLHSKFYLDYNASIFVGKYE